MPEPSFIQRMIDAARKIPGLQPATVNGAPVSSTALGTMKASNAAGKDFREYIGPDRADSMAAAVDALRYKGEGQTVGQAAPNLVPGPVAHAVHEAITPERLLNQPDDIELYRRAVDSLKQNKEQKEIDDMRKRLPTQ